MRICLFFVLVFVAVFAIADEHTDIAELGERRRANRDDFELVLNVNRAATVGTWLDAGAPSSGHTFKAVQEEYAATHHTNGAISRAQVARWLNKMASSVKIAEWRL